MLGTIKTIKEVVDVETSSSWLSMDGYKVETDEHSFYILISNGQSCCENWGYITSEDELDYFLGSELIEVNVTDTTLNKKILTKMDDDYINNSEIQFVDFKTNIGTFQLAVYNHHNGYYGHSILIRQNDKVLVDGCL